MILSHATDLLDLFDQSTKRGGDAPFLWHKTDGVYQPRSWNEVAAAIDGLAAGLAAAGLEPGDRVVIVGENRPDWLIADLAVLRVGGISVPAYTTNTENDHGHVLKDCGASAVILSGPQVATTLLPAIANAPDVRTVVTMDPMPGVAAVTGWEDIVAKGAASGPFKPHPVAPDDLACLIYTSGTGGQPKGVMLSHRNILANVDGAIDLLNELGIGDEVFLSFLPLSHSYEHTAGQFVPMSIGAQIYYAEGVDTLSQNLTEARPTILTCVPRLYEVLRQRISKQVERAGGMKAKLFREAIRIGTAKAEGKSLGPIDWLKDQLCERLVRSSVRQRFGGRLRAMVSGGAPLNYEVGMFFLSLGLPIYQGYGQTEASPVISANRPSRRKLQTVGPPLLGVDLKIADDGEILVRGPLVMQGYWNDPASTAKAIQNGWLHTGDVGSIDEQGLLTITGRKKDIIVNSGGDNISPQRVEGVVELQREIGQVLVYGDRRPHLVALIVPDAEWLRGFCAQAGLPNDLGAVHCEPALEKAIGEAIKRANAQLSVVERIRRFHIMDAPFSIQNEMMTPTLKLRRPIITERFKSVLEGLYAGRNAA